MSGEEFEFYGHLWILLVGIVALGLAAAQKWALDRWGRRAWKRAAKRLDFARDINSESGQPSLSGTRGGRSVEVTHTTWVDCPHSPILTIRVELHDFWDDIHIGPNIEGVRSPTTPIDIGDERLEKMLRIEALNQHAQSRQLPIDDIGSVARHLALASGDFRIADGQLQVEWTGPFVTPDRYERLVDWLTTVAACLDAIARGDTNEPPSARALESGETLRWARVLMWTVPIVLAVMLITGGWYFGVAGPLGAPCEGPVDCRSRLCLEETVKKEGDTTTHNYCSTECVDDHDCVGQLACHNVGTDDPYCMKPDLLRRQSEGAKPGEPCRSDSDCYSNICLYWDDFEDIPDELRPEVDADDPLVDESGQLPRFFWSQMCAAPCETDSECRQGFHCQWHACVPDDHSTDATGYDIFPAILSDHVDV